MPGILDAGSAANSAPACEALESLLDCASETVCSGDFTQHLCERFGLRRNNGELPLAALTRAAHGEHPDGDAFALLAVVHLHVDRDRAYVVPLASDSVTEAESDALQDLFSERLAAWQHGFYREDRALWTIKLRGSVALRTVALEQAAGRDAQACLPTGDKAREWLTLANELQMLLHTHPVNTRRQQTGQLTLNSVWLWGVGTLRETLASPFARVYSDCLFVRGLAALGGAPGDAPLEHFAALDFTGLGERPVCVALADACRGQQSRDWRDHIECLERDWFVPMRNALRRGSLQHLALWLGNDRIYRLTARQAGRWRLRKPRALRQYIRTGPA
jgi:hypothetical protein